MYHSDLIECLKKSNTLLILRDSQNEKNVLHFIRKIRGDYYHVVDSSGFTQFRILNKIREYRKEPRLEHIVFENIKDIQNTDTTKTTYIDRIVHTGPVSSMVFGSTTRILHHADMVLTISGNILNIIKNRNGYEKSFDLTELFQELSLPLSPL